MFLLALSSSRMMEKDVKNLLIHLGDHGNLKDDVHEKIRLRARDIDKILKESDSKDEAVQRGVKMFLFRLWNECKTVDDFRLKQSIASLVREDRYFVMPLNRLAAQLDNLH